jgi:ABC-type ATPase involved in cell division
LGAFLEMLDIIDWSKERPRHDDLGRYVLDVQMAAPKTKFVYHVGMSGSSSMLKELFIDLSQRGHVHLVQKPLDQSKNRTFAYIAIRSTKRTSE